MQQDDQTHAANRGTAPARRGSGTFDPRALTRPAPELLQYYVWASVPSLIAFPLVFLPLWFRYRTLQYRFDDEGVSMSWGMFYRREIHLTYRRIQDIHVTRNLLQRWLGLATLTLQTASGSAGSGMKIEGILQPELLRDYLYGKMRGAREESEGTEAAAEGLADEALRLLEEIRDQLRRLGDARSVGRAAPPGGRDALQ